MGSSREMTISAIAEPAMMLAIFTVALQANSTNLSEMAKVAVSQSWKFLAPSQMLAFAALVVVLIAETGRIPVDNPATHLELTMIHEAMILEYSGPYLALLEWGASIKQLVLMTLVVNTFFPFGLSSDRTAAGLALGLAFYLVKMLVLCCVIVLVETTNAKLRLFRVPELLMVAFILGALALISTFLF
jgi:formate hydrogenlyase subunit 4